MHFIPRVDSLERRENLGPLIGWWTIPQSSIQLTDNAGHAYPVANGQQLIAALKDIRSHGRMVDELAIKGHGYGGVIMLTDHGDTDTLAIVQGHALIDGEMVDNLLQDVTDANSAIWLGGCHTHSMGPSLSSVLGDHATVWVQELPFAVGIPWTSHTIGYFADYQDGQRTPVPTDHYYYP